MAGGSGHPRLQGSTPAEVGRRAEQVFLVGKVAWLGQDWDPVSA